MLPLKRETKNMRVIQFQSHVRPRWRTVTSWLRARGWRRPTSTWSSTIQSTTVSVHLGKDLSGELHSSQVTVTSFCNFTWAHSKGIIVSHQQNVSFNFWMKDKKPFFLILCKQIWIYIFKLLTSKNVLIHFHQNIMSKILEVWCRS